jgi:hypothetical protein
LNFVLRCQVAVDNPSVCCSLHEGCRRPSGSQL